MHWAARLAAHLTAVLSDAARGLDRVWQPESRDDGSDDFPATPPW